MKKIRLELKNKIFPLIYCNKLNKLFEITQKVSSWMGLELYGPKTMIDFFKPKNWLWNYCTYYLVVLQLFCAKTSKKFEVWFRSMITSFKNSLPLQWWILHISHLNALFTRNNTLPTTTDENQEKKCIYILKIFLPLVSICWDIIIIWRKLRLGLSSK